MNDTDALIESIIETIETSLAGYVGDPLTMDSKQRILEEIAKVLYPLMPVGGSFEINPDFTELGIIKVKVNNDPEKGTITNEG